MPVMTHWQLGGRRKRVHHINILTNEYIITVL